jgi:hypothetical protein
LRVADNCHARVGMLRAMNHGAERVFNPDRKETFWREAEAEAGSMTRIVDKAERSLACAVPELTRTAGIQLNKRV